MNSLPTFLFTHLNLTVRSPGGVLGDRFLSIFTNSKNMTFSIEISLPIYYPSTWNRLDKAGSLTISGTDYETVREQAEKLLDLYQAEGRLMPTIKSLTSQIETKQEKIAELNERISTSLRQISRLEDFLKSLGIDPRSNHLTYKPILVEEFKKYGVGQEVTVEVVEHDPIPFRGEDEEAKF